MNNNSYKKGIQIANKNLKNKIKSKGQKVRVKRNQKTKTIKSLLDNLLNIEVQINKDNKKINTDINSIINYINTLDLIIEINDKPVKVLAIR